MCCIYAKCVISVLIYIFCVRYCAAFSKSFTQSVKLVFEFTYFTQVCHCELLWIHTGIVLLLRKVFESASFTQRMQLLGHLQILLKLLCCCYKNVEFVVKFDHLRCFLANSVYCCDLRVFCVIFLSSKHRSRKSFDKYHVWRLPVVNNDDWVDYQSNR